LSGSPDGILQFDYIAANDPGSDLAAGAVVVLFM